MRFKLLYQLLFATLTLCLSSTGAMAQACFNGKRPASDSRTQSLLIAVPTYAMGNCYTMTVQLDDSVTWMTIGSQDVDSEVCFPLVAGDTTYVMQYSTGDTVMQRELRFTSLPILQLWGTFGQEYADGTAWLDEPDQPLTDTLLVSMRWAGGSTNRTWYHKHHYHMKLVDGSGNKVNRSLLGLRSDNHWRLDAGLIDMGRIRNHTANTLWADFNVKPYYADKQPTARTYTRGKHVEVFLNGVYRGFYDLTECLDRKQLKLKKYDDQQSPAVIHGQLWKGKDETDATMFISPDEPCDSTQQAWAGFQLQYPDIDDVCPADYSTLRQAVNFVANSNGKQFSDSVANYFDLPALAHYYVFINVLLAIDNSCKNLLWACYDRQTSPRLTPAIWDLDATVGQHWSDIDACYRIPAIGPENELTVVSKLGKSRLFSRLMALPNFRQQVLDTYWQLRTTVLHPDSLVARYNAVFDTLQASGALWRETQRWSGDTDIARRTLDFDDERQYITDWLTRRIAYLDTHTFAIVPADVNNDGEVTIADVGVIVDVILSGNSDDISADVNGDGEVSLADVNATIDVILNGN